jgi:8-oxo-dGTP diphosphatase
VPELVIVTAGLIEERGRFLIAQRHPDSHLGGYWEFPGGKLEADESPEDCLRRELREELGIEAEVSGIARVVFHRYPTFNILLLVYRCTVIAGDPVARECQAWKWASPEEIAALPFPPADALVLEDLLHAARSS